MFIFSLVYTMIISFTMIGFGALFIKRPPKEINSVVGYRTKRSSKNKRTWAFAHRYAGRTWLYSGVATSVVSFILIFIFKDSAFFENLLSVLFIVQLVALLFVIPLTEIALRKTFDKNGRLKV